MTEELRSKGFSAEFDFGSKKFKKQLEKASKTAKYALILLEDEIKNNKVTIKNLDTSEQVTCLRDEAAAHLN